MVVVMAASGMIDPACATAEGVTSSRSTRAKQCGQVPHGRVRVTGNGCNESHNILTLALLLIILAHPVNQMNQTDNGVAIVELSVKDFASHFLHESRDVENRPDQCSVRNSCNTILKIWFGVHPPQKIQQICQGGASSGGTEVDCLTNAIHATKLWVYKLMQQRKTTLPSHILEESSAIILVSDSGVSTVQKLGEHGPIAISIASSGPGTSGIAWAHAAMSMTTGKAWTVTVDPVLVVSSSVTRTVLMVHHEERKLLRGKSWCRA
jgi:hypothetical protein